MSVKCEVHSSTIDETFYYKESCPYCEIQRLRKILIILSTCEEESSWGDWVRELALDGLAKEGE